MNTEIPYPPHSIEAEQSVLGSLLLQNDAYVRIAGQLNEADFYRSSHRAIWRAIIQMIDSGKTADVITVAEALDSHNELENVGGLTYLAMMAQNTPSAANILTYAEIVREHSRKRAMIAGLGQALQTAERDGTATADDIAKIVEEKLAGIDTAHRTLWPKPIAMAELVLREPVPPKFIVADWLPCGYATLMAGHGGIGKSGIALSLVVCIALGLPFFGLPTQGRRVMYLSCEDRAQVLHWRLARICEYLGLELTDLTDRLDIVDLVGHPSILWSKTADGGTLTAAYAELEARMKNGPQVLIIDGIADVYDGNENARAEVKAFVNSLLALIPPEDGAVLLLGHVNRSTAAGNGSTEGYSGSTGWNNSVRARWYLYPETRSSDGEPAERTGDLILELQKSNHGPTDRAMKFRWSDADGMFIGELIGGESNFERKQREREEIEGIIAALRSSQDYVPAATSGPRTAYNVLSAQPNFPESLRGGTPARKRFWRHIEALRANGQITESSIRRGNRHATAVLVASDKGSANASNV